MFTMCLASSCSSWLQATLHPEVLCVHLYAVVGGRVEAGELGGRADDGVELGGGGGPGGRGQRREGHKQHAVTFDLTVPRVVPGRGSLYKPIWKF